MKVFMDTEFTGLHQGTTLISIGLISEDNKRFYAEITDYDKSQVNEWIQENVIDKLWLDDYLDKVLSEATPLFGDMPEHLKPKMNPNLPKGRISIDNIKDEHFVKCKFSELKPHIEAYFRQFDEVEIWSDCLAYDWVLFNQIFGHAFNIPSNVHYIPFDICTVFKLKGIDPDIGREIFCEVDKNEDEIKKHTALWDAEIIKMCYEKLESI